jgi:hypothetical protein
VALFETALLVGVALAVWGAVSLLFDSVLGGGDRRFVAYLVSLLLALAIVGYLLLTRL